MKKFLITIVLLLYSQSAFASYATTVIADTPLIYYRLGESSGTSATDSSGNSHTGVYSSSNITYAQTGLLTGDTATSVAIASGGYMDTEQISLIAPNMGNFSIECWMKSSATSLQVMFGAADSSLLNDNYWMGINSTVGKASFSAKNSANSSGVTTTSSATVNDGQRHYLAGTMNGATMTIYVDGSASGTPATWVTGTNLAPTGQLVVGQFGNYNGSLNYVGNAQECAYYNYALTPTQIANHYTAGTTASGMSISPSTINPHTSNITLTLTGGGTSWSNASTIFTVSGAGATKVSQNVTSATAATVVINTASQSGTVTVTETVTGSTSNTTSVNPYIQYFASPSGVATMILEPASYVPGKGIRLIFYHMGHGEDDTALLSDSLKAGIVASALSANYLMAGISAGNTWGNQASLTAYKEAYAYIASQYHLLGTLIWGQSMGGLAAQSNLAAGAYPDTRGFIGIYPACSLLDMYSDDGGAFTTEINTAYNIPGGGTYAAQTAGYDPLLLPAVQYQGNAEHFYSSYGDTVVMRANNTDPMAALITPYTWEHSVVTTTGNHGDPTNFQPSDFMAFVGRAFRQTLGNGMAF